jgi:23S rRNA pseudoU1915 N3-methylase RlmH
MLKIIIFSDSFKHFEESIKEYEKRLSKEIEIIKLKPSKRKEAIDIISEETNILKEKLEKEK